MIAAHGSILAQSVAQFDESKQTHPLANSHSHAFTIIYTGSHAGIFLSLARSLVRSTGCHRNPEMDTNLKIFLQKIPYRKLLISFKGLMRLKMLFLMT